MSSAPAAAKPAWLKALPWVLVIGTFSLLLLVPAVGCFGLLVWLSMPGEVTSDWRSDPEFTHLLLADSVAVGGRLFSDPDSGEMWMVIEPEQTSPSRLLDDITAAYEAAGYRRSGSGSRLRMLHHPSDSSLDLRLYRHGKGVRMDLRRPPHW